MRLTNWQVEGTLFVSPTNFMMKGVWGARMISLGLPICSTFPRLKITTLSARSKASSCERESV